MTTELTGNFINLTPTDGGYANMATRFIQSVLGDVKASRKKDSEELLKSAVEIVFFLGSKHGQAIAEDKPTEAQELAELRNFIMKNTF